MAKLQTFLLAAALGALCGLVLVDLTAPAYLKWYNIPGGGGALCNCEEVVNATAHSLLRAQWLAAGIGSGLFLVGAAFLSIRRKEPPAALRQPADL